MINNNNNNRQDSRGWDINEAAPHMLWILEAIEGVEELDRVEMKVFNGNELTSAKEYVSYVLNQLQIWVEPYIETDNPQEPMMAEPATTTESTTTETTPTSQEVLVEALEDLSSEVHELSRLLYWHGGRERGRSRDLHEHCRQVLMDLTGEHYPHWDELS